MQNIINSERSYKQDKFLTGNLHCSPGNRRIQESNSESNSLPFPRPHAHTPGRHFEPRSCNLHYQAVSRGEKSDEFLPGAACIETCPIHASTRSHQLQEHELNKFLLLALLKKIQNDYIASL